MKQEQVQGNWEQLKGNILKEWGKLTEDDLQQIKGDVKILKGKLVERYGITKEQAAEKAEQFMEKMAVNGSELIAKMGDMAENVNEKAHDMVQCCNAYLKKNPLKTVGIVALAGLVIGALMSRK
jgi:ElaB/YqjD/DUF883 family membrane-anchored ribosome-binding protein